MEIRLHTSFSAAASCGSSAGAMIALSTSSSRVNGELASVAGAASSPADMLSVADAVATAATGAFVARFRFGGCAI